MLTCTNEIKIIRYEFPLFPINHKRYWANI